MTTFSEKILPQKAKTNCNPFMVCRGMSPQAKGTASSYTVKRGDMLYSYYCDCYGYDWCCCYYLYYCYHHHYCDGWLSYNNTYSQVLFPTYIYRCDLLAAEFHSLRLDNGQKRIFRSTFVCLVRWGKDQPKHTYIRVYTCGSEPSMVYIYILAVAVNACLTV